MGDSRWDRLQAVFLEALGRSGPAREAYLDEATGGDAALRDEVVAMLAAEATDGGFTWVGRLDAAMETETAPAKTTAEIPRGTRIGSYVVRDLLGRGGMGRVYLAERTDQYRQRVALKVVRDDYDGALLAERFLAERQILAQLQHPHISTLLDGGVTDDGRPYLVMQYEPGLPITTHCDEAQLGIRRRLELFATVCDAVHYAHTNLVVHRDLKPSNILVGDDGHPKLLDFGIAKILEGGGDHDHPPTGDVRMFSPEHAAPEQVAGEAITTATDVYALGILLYELLTGRRPFRSAQTAPLEFHRRILEDPPTRPSEEAARPADPVESEQVTHPARLRRTGPEGLARSLKGDLDAIVLMALRKEPERRYASARELAMDVRRHLAGHPVTARPDSVGYRVGSFVRRHRLAVAATAAVAGLVAALAATMTVLNTRLSAEQTRTRTALDESRAVTDFLVGLFDAANPDDTADRLTARDLLERGAERADELADEPTARAAVLNSIGRAFHGLAEYERAEPLLEEALALRRSSLGDLHPDVALSLNALADLRMDARGEYEAAAGLLAEALEIQRGVDDRAGRGVAFALASLGAAQFRLGKVDEARASFEEAVEILEGPDIDEPDVLGAALSNLGLAMVRLGDPGGAEATLRRAVDVQRGAWGEDHANVAAARNLLAEALLRQERFDEALALYDEVLRRREAIYGPDHPAVAPVINNMAQGLRLAGRLEEAVPYARRSVALARASFGPTHPNLGLVVKNLGIVLQDLGRWAEAEGALVEALEIHRAVFGDDHVQVRQIRERLAQIYEELGRADEADRYREPSG